MKGLPPQPGQPRRSRAAQPPSSGACALGRAVVQTLLLRARPSHTTRRPPAPSCSAGAGCWHGAVDATRATMSCRSQGQNVGEGAAGMALLFSVMSWASAGLGGWAAGPAGFASAMASFLTGLPSGRDGCHLGALPRRLLGLVVPAQGGFLHGDSGLRVCFPGGAGAAPLHSEAGTSPRPTSAAHGRSRGHRPGHLRVGAGGVGLTGQ